MLISIAISDENSHTHTERNMEDFKVSLRIGIILDTKRKFWQFGDWRGMSEGGGGGWGEGGGG